LAEIDNLARNRKIRRSRAGGSPELLDSAGFRPQFGHGKFLFITAEHAETAEFFLPKGKKLNLFAGISHPLCVLPDLCGARLFFGLENQNLPFALSSVFLTFRFSPCSSAFSFWLFLPQRAPRPLWLIFSSRFSVLVPRSPWFLLLARLDGDFYPAI
jgi:hypothetical protein